MTAETLKGMSSYDLRLFLNSVNVLLDRGISPTGILEYVNKVEDEPLRDKLRTALFESISPEDQMRILKVEQALKEVAENNAPLKRNLPQ